MKNRKFTSLLLTVSLVVLSMPVFAQAQEGKKKTEAQVATTPTQSGTATFSVSGDGAVAITSGNGGFTFVSSFGFKETVVKGAPMSAEAVSESIQVLSDGNRIVRKSTTMIYRDSEGRSRREQTISSIGPYATAGEPSRLIHINDPVAGVSYILDVRSKTAQKIVFTNSKEFTVATTDAAKKAAIEKGVAEAKASGEGISVSGNSVTVINGVATTGSYSGRIPKPEQKEESLGEQVMEGLKVEGKRYTSTIPAGQIGNEQPINIVTEKWYSQELKQVVYMKTTDPRFGETIYRLTNINRTEPDRSLFEVPSDYIIKETANGVIKVGTEKKVQTTKPQQ
jgi:hypothetical protein